jgi:lycopene beta-cyclase
MHDVILVGGGLANGLIAWRLRLLRPELRILLLERDDTLGGNHTWSFYRDDLSAGQIAWLQPMITRAWPAYEVRFPTHRRLLDTPCYSISSERFHTVLADALGDAVMLGTTATSVASNGVHADGRFFPARAVIDGRGPAPSTAMQCAYQKFVGQEVVLRAPHGQANPIIMDAAVAQADGYRFVYTLPYDARRILVEDTYYSTDAGLDIPTLRKRIAAYVASRGWEIASIEREEAGVLPIVLSGDIDGFWQSGGDRLPRSGLRAGLFHATTGYSLPHAVRLADGIAALPSLDADMIYQHVRDRSLQAWRQQFFMRMLNRMLFFAGEPHLRYRLLQRFYTLPRQLIERFYAGRLTRLDQLRILSGKPPVPVLSALRALCNPGKERSSKPS